ncbi:protein TASOR isoform X2 [Melanotaenia boesemani]|uniref:protein TASOR isoform X2 n=1 Tax=Melanotaenia boesemani TaxID=1250792 RepID=UPI001C0533AC|nr:protein TASOR isoform X2 [Melanotaenia boesemani]
MDDILARRAVFRPRRVSAAANLGANVSLQDGEGFYVSTTRETQPDLGRISSFGGRMERRNSAPQVVHQRHMPMEPKKFHIPRKTKEKKALFQYISTESREYEDMKTILTSSYIDTNSTGCFTYRNPRLVHSELLEKEFVEKRKEMKAEGRTDKELEESYCFLLTNFLELTSLCEKGLTLGQTRITVLGDPNKGVYLSRYSDLLQMNSFTPGTTGEIIIFKVMKGKVKSIYENMKNVVDPTPRFDSHIAKNASKITSLTCYRAFELTQQYFYEYSFDELRQRPRQVCPYAVVAFQIKGKDAPLPNKPLTPIRLNSQSSESSKAQFTVWSGELTKNNRVLFQISLCSSSSPFLPHRVPEKLEIGYLMRLDQVTKLLHPGLFSYNLYNSSQEVVTNDHYCSLLEVIDRNRSTTSVTKLLQELEIKRVVLVTPLTDRGFLFLLSSVQMATPNERGETWKRCLQALFVFPETRDVAKSTSRYTSSSEESLVSGVSVMSRLSEFIPALHHALVKARANPPPKLSIGVELQTREYLTGLTDGSVRQYSMTAYDSKADEEGQLFPPPKHHQVNMDSYLQSYLSSPMAYLLSVARAKEVVEAHCGSVQPQETRHRNSYGSQTEAMEKRATSNKKDGETDNQKMQQLLDLILTCKRNAENEVRREEGAGLKAPERKRKMEQETAERALKYFKASQGHRKQSKIPVDGSSVPSAPVSLASVMGFLGLKDVDLREDGSELATRLTKQLTDLIHAANQSHTETKEEGPKESNLLGRLAAKLGLPANCDIDLRTQEELEEQTAGSISSLEGFSPSSHSGDTNHHGAAGRGGGRVMLGRKAEANEQEEEEWEIPWVLIPITGLCSDRYSQRDKNTPQDPRFQHLTMETIISTKPKPSRKSPTLSPESSSSASPFQFPSPEASLPPSPSQCPSPDPSPPLSPSQCPSPEPSPPTSPSQCISPEPSPPLSPSQCPSPQPSPPTSPASSLPPEINPLLSSSQFQSLELNKFSSLIKDRSGANEQHLAPTAFREFPALSGENQMKSEEPSLSTPIHPFNAPALGQLIKLSPPPTEEVEEAEGKVEDVKDNGLEERNESQLPEKGLNQCKEAADKCKPDKREVEDMILEVTSEKEKNTEVEGGSVFSPLFSTVACPHRNIDSIVDKHMGDFSSEIQLLLQGERVHYSIPQPPNSTLDTKTTTSQHTFHYTSVSQFSEYVSFYNPCPPVQDYVSPLRDSINRMLIEYIDSWPQQKTDSSWSNTDTTLASTVSDFVASVRAANSIPGREDDVSGLRGEQTVADIGLSVCQDPAHSRGDDVWRHDTTNWSSPTSQVTLTNPTSASGPVYKPGNSLEISRTVTQNIKQTQDNSTRRTVVCAAVVEDEGDLAVANCTITVPGLGAASVPVAEPSQSFESVSSLISASVPEASTGPTPSAKDLNSVINQLEPDVLNNLVEIMKDIKRKSLQFYIHCTEPGDHVYEEIKEHLLKLGNVPQSPMDFLNQESSDSGLLVIIKNKDIAGHIHKIPGLVSLKRHSSVVFAGIDSLDDVKNNSCIELFVSGGCIVSDDLVLSPDVVTKDQLAALLRLLEQHSSPESVWRWKIHCKTHKKLKEQARFRRDAANLLDLLTSYQKRQIVDLLPYHHCDMNPQSPDLDCLIELQARYTQFRHTVFLTERHHEKFPVNSKEGIIVAGIEEILHNFTTMVGCHNIKEKQLLVEDLLAPKGLSKQLTHGDSVLASELSPSAVPDHIHSISSSHQPQYNPSQSSSSIHASDQLVPDTLCEDRMPLATSRDMEFLQQAIRQLRAERWEQLQQLQQQQQQLELEEKSRISPLKNVIPNPVGSGSDHETPPLAQGDPTESSQHTPASKVVSATLESTHSNLWKENGCNSRQQPPTEGRKQRGSTEGEEPGDQIERSPERVVGFHKEKWAPDNGDASTPSSNQSTAAAAGLNNQTEPTNDKGEEMTAQQEQPEISQAAKPDTSATYSQKDDRSSKTQSTLEQPVRAEVPPSSNSTSSSTEVTGTRITVVTNQEYYPNPTLNHLHFQQPQLRPQQNLNDSHSPSQTPPYSQQPQRSVGLLQTPHMPRFHGQPFPPGPLLGPLTPLGGIRGFLGPPHLWPGSLSRTGAPLVWGFQQTGRDFLRGYYNPAAPGSNMYRGGRGGGFNGM